jgi:hypothetical protein
MLKIILVEDNVDLSKDIMRWLSAKFSDLDLKVINIFVEAEMAIRKFKPDIVILDLFEGTVADKKISGQGTYDFIWNQRFCPIVIYSAMPEAVTNKHPFIKIVKKGSESREVLEQAIADLQPQVKSIHESEEHIRDQFSVALREVAPYAYDNYQDPAKRNDVIIRCGRRRLAAFMDELSKIGDTLASWEQYISPPVSENPLLGDVIRLAKGDAKKADDFRVVLTPSCDLESAVGRTPKVNYALVAQCCLPKDGLKMAGIPGIPQDRLQKHAILTQGYQDALVPLPSLEGRIPTMMINLRKLELIPLSDISKNGTVYIRIASLDSPFRELISWAYMNIACRPGLPVRDFSDWSKEIIEASKA